jgi:hypothetical protein
MCTQRRDQRLVHTPCQHHQRSITSLRIRNAESRDKLALLAHLRKRRGQLLTAAMDHGNLIPVAHQFGDSLAARMQQHLVLDCGASELDDVFHFRPSDSSQPHITFMF